MGVSTTGSDNIAIGTGALPINDSAGNIVIGSGAMGASITGLNNIAIGSAALAINQAAGNIAIGDAALAGNAVGLNTIAIGNAAGVADVVGLNNIWIGSPGFPLAETIGIGTPGLHVFCFIQGIFDFPTPNPTFVNILPTGQLGIFVPAPSSAKYKHNIRDMNVDSEIIYKLRPVTFEYNSDNSTSYGLVAEEVNEIDPYLIIPHPHAQKTGEYVYSVDYKLLTPFLLNEIIKLNSKVTDLQKEVLTIEELRADNKKMGDIINDLIARITKLES
jgi:hypothetical protein